MYNLACPLAGDMGTILRVISWHSGRDKGVTWESVFTQSKPQGAVCLGTHEGCKSPWVFLLVLFPRDYFYFVLLFYYFYISKYRVASTQSERWLHVDMCVDSGPNSKCDVKYRNTVIDSLKLKEWF